MPASNKPWLASFCQIVLSCLACGSLLRCCSGWWNYIWTQTLNCWGVNSFWAKRQNSFAKATNNVFEGIRFGMWCGNAWIIAISWCALWHLVCALHIICCTPLQLLLPLVARPMARLRWLWPPYVCPRPNSPLDRNIQTTLPVKVCLSMHCPQPLLYYASSLYVAKRWESWKKEWACGQITRLEAKHDTTGLAEFPRQRRRIQLSAGPASSKPLLIASHQICQGSRTKHHRLGSRLTWVSQTWDTFIGRRPGCKLSDLKWERSLSGLRR